ncbi:MAG: hypothetical protein V1826_02230 [bacterium]
MEIRALFAICFAVTVLLALASIVLYFIVRRPSERLSKTMVALNATLLLVGSILASLLLS